MAKYTNDPPIIYHKKFNDEEKHMYVSLDEKRINNYFLFNKKLLDPYDYDGYCKNLPIHIGNTNDERISTLIYNSSEYKIIKENMDFLNYKAMLLYYGEFKNKIFNYNSNLSKGREDLITDSDISRYLIFVKYLVDIFVRKKDRTKITFKSEKIRLMIYENIVLQLYKVFDIEKKVNLFNYEFNYSDDLKKELLRITFLFLELNYIFPMEKIANENIITYKFFRFKDLSDAYVYKENSSYLVNGIYINLFKKLSLKNENFYDQINYLRKFSFLNENLPGFKNESLLKNLIFIISAIDIRFLNNIMEKDLEYYDLFFINLRVLKEYIHKFKIILDKPLYKERVTEFLKNEFKTYFNIDKLQLNKLYFEIDSYDYLIMKDREMLMEFVYSKFIISIEEIKKLFENTNTLSQGSKDTILDLLEIRNYLVSYLEKNYKDIYQAIMKDINLQIKSNMEKALLKV